MKLLLDTQCWLWWFAQPERLNEEAIARIAEETNELWFSVASIWEMGIKVANGKLPLPEPIDTYINTRMVLLESFGNTAILPLFGQPVRKIVCSIFQIIL